MVSSLDLRDRRAHAVKLETFDVMPSVIRPRYYGRLSPADLLAFLDRVGRVGRLPVIHLNGALAGGSARGVYAGSRRASRTRRSRDGFTADTRSMGLFSLGGDS